MINEKCNSREYVYVPDVPFGSKPAREEYRHFSKWLYFNGKVVVLVFDPCFRSYFRSIHVFSSLLFQLRDALFIFQ